MTWTAGQWVTADELNTAEGAAFPAGSVSGYGATLVAAADRATVRGLLGIPSADANEPNGWLQLDSGGLVPIGLLPATSTPVTSVAGHTGAVTLAIADIGGISTISATFLAEATAAAQRVTLGVDTLQTVADANASLASGKFNYVWTSLSAARVARLQAASAYNPGQIIILTDGSASASASNTITALVNATPGTDQIIGDSVISSAGGRLVLISDGSGNFYGALAGNTAQVNVPIRQTVLFGPVNSNGYARFWPATSGSLAVATTGLITAAIAAGYTALGSVDKIVRLASGSSITLPASQAFVEIYVDATGALSYSVLPFVIKRGTPYDTTSGQHTYDPQAGQMFLGNGSTAPAVSKVPLGSAATSSSGVTNTVCYAYQRSYRSALTTVPGSGSPASFAHNLGLPIEEIDWDVWWQNVSAENGYTPGMQTTSLESANASGGGTLTVSGKFMQDRNTAGMVRGSSSTLMFNPTNGTSYILSVPTNWKLVALARGRY